MTGQVDTTGNTGGGAGGQGAEAKPPVQQGGAGTGQVLPQINWLPNAAPEDVAYVASKGWDKATNPAEAILGSYRNLEKLFGADKAGNTVVLPGQTADEKTLNDFYVKLGRPETADKYSVAPKDFAGMPEEAAASLRDVAFKNGLTDKQVKAIQEWNNTTGASIKEKLESDAQVQLAQQTQKLNAEWGAAAAQNLQQAKEATAKLGWTKEQIDAMQIGIGYDGVMKLAHQLAPLVGEGKFISGEGGRQPGSGSVMTPDQAKAALSALNNDAAWKKDWMDKHSAGHKAAVEKKAQLTAWAYPS